jgi:aryl-alcohol dehydrogenase-like predicted oxidoreductase
MPNFDDVTHRKDCRPDRRSFLRTTGIAAAAMFGNHALPALGQQSAMARAEPMAKGRRKLGTLEVSSVGIGCQDFTGTFYATHPNRADMIKLARAVHEHGVTLFDAAEAYGPLEVERILGEALAPVRNEVVYSSKFGWDIDPDTGRMMGGLNSRPEHIRQSIHGMLKRWRTDRIDLVYQHRVDPKVPIEDVAGTIKDLVAQGKVLHYGLSEPGPNTIRRAHAVHPGSAVQNEYSMMARGSENDIMPVCKELGIGFVCWSPLAMGFLTGTVDENTRFQPGDFRGSVPWFTPENRPGNFALLGVVKEWAQRKNATPTQIALAWQLAREPWIVTIPGTTKMPHMLENIGADGVNLPPAEFRELNTALTHTPVHGERLSLGLLALSGVEAPAKQ